ncbi:tyrosine-protein phosphatase [Sphingobacterium sp. HJSM2_6]|uniref:tyrosine-protein phosphatase n=1 Tax=Sphingobacterium sp. HJSM2_6 TaxID=3366264 RepID=UPI003BBE2A75
MFSFFSRNSANNDLKWINADMHSHILPGIDDGCAQLEDSLHILERLSNLGIQKFHFTPHIFKEMYPNNEGSISHAFESLKGKGVDSLLGSYAAEYMLDSGFPLEENQSGLLSLPGNYVLIEMSYIQENKQIEKTIFDIQIQGYKPILAHPERYVFYHQDPSKLVRFKEIGCLMQVNLLSVLGYYGANEKRVAKYLASKGLVSLVGTDVHHERHVKALEIGLKKSNLYSFFKECKILNAELFSYS